jgi:hypothetical protein
VRAVVMVTSGRFRQHWKSWLALSVLVAVAGGFVMAATAAARRTDTAFPGFVARHGYDFVVYSSHPLPRLASLQGVESVTPVLAPFSDQASCGSCSKPIDTSNFLVNEVPPKQLPRMIKLLSGRLPDESRPSEVLASRTLATENGVRIGSVIRVLLYRATARGPVPAGRRAFRVVGIAVTEGEFPTGITPHYDLFATPAFATAAATRGDAQLSIAYVRLRAGAAGVAGFSGRLRSLDVLGTDDLDGTAATVQSSIRPQVIGWYMLAALATIAALAVIGQALARQAASERADHQSLAVLGLRPREFVLIDLLRALLIGAAGAAGAVGMTVLLSPLTPAGEARLAVRSPGRVSFDPLVLALGALAVLAAVAVLSAWPAIRHARLRGGRAQRQAESAALAAGRAAAVAGLPASALIGIRQALRRGSGGQPVGTALLGMVMAVAALCATAVFGASLARLVSSPALYGSPFQAYFAPNGTSGSASVVTGPLLASLRRDHAIRQVTLAAEVPVEVNGQHVRALAVTAVRGAALVSTVDGRRPHGDREIMLGAATMRATGARLGGFVWVTVSDGAGTPHRVRFRVIGRASLNAGLGGLGSGAAMTTAAFISAQCPPGHSRAACTRPARRGIASLSLVLVRAASGPAGHAALARYIRQHRTLAYRPGKPAALVNFGEAVNFPLLFGVALSLFGAATMAHLLLVSVARRRREAGLLKVLGFLRRQVAAVVCWQATAVALTGIAIGAPVGIAAGKVFWRVFATNFGVVPVAVADPLLLAALVTGVLAAANVLAGGPALIAARSHPGALLRAE